MPEKPGTAMGDIIGSTRNRIRSQEGDPASRLKSLVPPAQTMSTSPNWPPAVFQDVQTPDALPSNYFPQNPSVSSKSSRTPTPKEPPLRKNTRDSQVVFRLTIEEREQLVSWCRAENLSFADGVMKLLNDARKSN